jgi:SAM-dependent methyltransferase
MRAEAKTSTAERYYEEESAALLARYEAVTFEQVHADLVPLLPVRPGNALDVGAGSGRDAAWLARRGWAVVAAEPSHALREGGRNLHPSANIRWLDDSLPDLAETNRLSVVFDLVLLSAVWMHVSPSGEETAFRSIAGLSRPGTILNMTVRMGGDERRRGFHVTDGWRLQRLASAAGFSLVAETMNDDALGRAAVNWKSLIFRMDGVEHARSASPAQKDRD